VDALHSLPKRERLQHGYEFRRVYEQGRKVIGRLAVVHVWEPPAPAGRRVGVVTSRRVGNAVARNRARRLLRAAYRLQKPKLKQNVDVVIVARQAINGRRCQDVTAELRGLFEAVGLIGCD